MIHERTLQALEYTKIVNILSGYCVSETGREAALQVRPFHALADIHKAARLYEQCRTWASIGGNAAFSMTAFPDIRGVVEQAGASHPHLDLDAFWALRETLRLARHALTSLRQNDAARQWPDLLALAESCLLPQQLLPALERCLSDDGLLKDESSPELYLVRTELRRLHQNCMRRVKDYAIQYNILAYLQDEFMTLASDRYVLPLKANFKGRMQGIIHDWSQTGETCYFEPMFLVEINNKLQELKRQEREEENKVIQYLVNLLQAEKDQVCAAGELLRDLDVLFAKVRLGECYDGHCLTVTDNAGDPVNLLQARHPLLLLAAGNKQTAIQAVHPIDITLRPGERCLVISGGNAGGKTVCLKTLGLSAAMTLAGLPVPAEKGSALPYWQRIDAFIGDEQSLDDHVSTFTAQIKHLARSWKYLNKGALVLLDEFGAGTDPAQGAALAQALLDELLDHDVYVLAATHFPALKAYALTREKTRAASVLFDPSTKKPLFCLAYDQVGASQALDVAREHGMPEAVLRRAEHYLLTEGQDTSALIHRLNELAITREQELDELRKETAKQRAHKERLQAQFEKERRKLYDEVRQQSSELMRAWKEGKATHKQALKEMSQLRTKLLPQPEVTPNTTSLDASSLSMGQQVLHRPFDKRGNILEIDGRRNKVRLDINGVCIWANIQDIELVTHTTPVKAANATHVTRNNAVALTLDLRGKRADLAISDVEQFLDKALLAGLESVEIIHGRGTGVLRKELHNFLRTFPAVSTFSLAPEDRGGDGMTIVVFR